MAYQQRMAYEAFAARMGHRLHLCRENLTLKLPPIDLGSEESGGRRSHPHPCRNAGFTPGCNSPRRLASFGRSFPITETDKLKLSAENGRALCAGFRMSLPTSSSLYSKASERLRAKAPEAARCCVACRPIESLPRRKRGSSHHDHSTSSLSSAGWLTAAVGSFMCFGRMRTTFFS